jgi:hypothetical protein
MPLQEAEYQEQTLRPLKASDVVALFPMDAEHHKAYGLTVVGWGHDPAWSSRSRDLDQLKNLIDSSRAMGTRIFSANVELSSATAWVLADDPDLKEAVLRDVNGEPIVVPWFKPWAYEGIEMYWGCINNPVYRKNVRERVRTGFEAGADALHFDMPCGSARFSLGGCFCDFCIEGFREYLNSAFTEEELRSRGIGNVEDFNYPDLVRSFASSREAFIRAYDEGGIIPLIEEYETYQRMEAAGLITEMRDLARELGGPETPTSVNAWGFTPQLLACSQFADFFVAEVYHGEGTPRARPSVPFAYKLADALGKNLAASGDGADWRYIQVNSAEGLARMWIALSYAMGHHFMVPYRQWVFLEGIQMKGNNYTGPIEEYAPLYRFVRQNADLFDEYETVEQVGLLYNNRAFAATCCSRDHLRYDDHHEIHDAGLSLLDANIPYGVAIAGDDWLLNSLSEKELSRFELILVPEPQLLEGEQKRLVDGWMQSGRAIPWKGAEDVIGRVEPLVSLESKSSVWVLPRRIPDRPEAPLVVHLVNWDYIPSTDRPNVQSAVTVRLSNKLLDGREIREAMLFSPQHEPVVLDCENRSDGIYITVPDLELWGLLRLDRL